MSPASSRLPVSLLIVDPVGYGYGVSMARPGGNALAHLHRDVAGPQSFGRVAISGSVA